MLLAVALSGCAASVTAALDSKDRGTAKVYPVAEHQAWEIARTAFRWVGCAPVDVDRANHVMTSSFGRHKETVMACWIEPVDASHTTVTMVSKRRYLLGPITGPTEREFHRAYQRAVEMVKAGKSLPVR